MSDPWRPNRWQWVVIWVSAVAALVPWLASALADESGGRFALGLLAVGGLLVWQLNPRPKRQVVATGRDGPITELELLNLIHNELMDVNTALAELIREIRAR